MLLQKWTDILSVKYYGWPSKLRKPTVNCDLQQVKFWIWKFVVYASGDC